MAPHYSIEIESCSSNVCVVVLRGDHDLAARPGVTTALAVASSHINVLVDLSECTYIDSAVLGEVMVAWTRLRERDGSLELVVRRDAHALLRTLEIASPPAVLRHHETRAAGIARLDAAGRLRALRRARQDLREVTAKVDRLRATAGALRTAETAKRATRVTVVRAQVADEALEVEPAFPTAERTRPNGNTRSPRH